MSYFNQPKKSDDEEKENNSRRQLKSTISDKKDSKILINETNITKKRRSKIKQEELSSIIADKNFLSSVQVEKTSLILFDEVCFCEEMKNLLNFIFSLDRNINNRRSFLVMFKKITRNCKKTNYTHIK